MNDYSDDDIIQLSAIQHFAFCERQCYLIHAEQLWCENYSTISGQLVHERSDSGETSYTEDGIRQVRSLLLFSRRFGLSGRADLVEFDDRHGRKVYPVEYKLGAPKSNDCDAVQLCAQAFCLEEMLGISIREGAIFYHRIRRRDFFPLTDDLREKTAERIRQTHQLLRQEQPPPPCEKKSCSNCSLMDLCFPQLTKLPRPADYLRRILREEDML